MYREALAAALANEFSVWHVAPDGIKQLADRNVGPEVLVLDEASVSVSTVAEVLSVCPECRLMVITRDESVGTIAQYLEAGVLGVVKHSADLPELREAARALLSGQPYCPPELLTMLFRTVAANNESGKGAVPAALTPREEEVLEFIRGGLSNKQISRNLGISVSTVKHHVHNLLQKLGATSRSAAAARSRDAAEPEK